MTAVLQPASRMTMATRRPALVLALCAAVAFLDGFDTQAIGPAAPAIAREIGLFPAALGPVFSASQLGFLAGASLFGGWGDRTGRRRALVIATVIFATATLGTAFAADYASLLACRLLAGVGLGGATPNFVGLASEFAPARHRSRAVTLLWAAVPLGGMAGSFTSAWLLPRAGWHAVFLVGAAAPLVLVLFMIALMPESSEAAAETRASARALLVRDVRRRTIWLWLASFATWTTLVVTAFWMPALLERTGWSPAGAAAMLALGNAGGVIGTLVVGSAIGRLSAPRALGLALAGAAVLTAVLGLLLGMTGGFAATAFLAGCCASAAGGCVLAVAAGLYHPGLRATAVGWSLAVGRTGTIVGPIAVGMLVAAGASVPAVFATIAAIALAGALASIKLVRASEGADA